MFAEVHDIWTAGIKMLVFAVRSNYAVLYYTHAYKNYNTWIDRDGTQLPESFYYNDVYNLRALGDDWTVISKTRTIKHYITGKDKTNKKFSAIFAPNDM